MKVPYGWLQEFVEELPPVAELVNILDGLGLAVEAVHDYPGAAQGTVAVVLESVLPVEGSEHLLQVTAFDGKEHHQVLTGAPNVREGMVTAFARPGVHLPALNGTVEAKQMAGLTSDGVLLSPRELGVQEYAGGLIEFGGDVEPGLDLAAAWPAEQVIELELTPNRADAFSLLGIARDVAAKLAVPYRDPSAGLDAGDPEADDGLTVEIDDSQGCPLLTLKRIDDVKVAASPLWLQRRLSSMGLRPRNNVVDVTNLVTFELGQPSHAYDARRLAHGTLQVRRARAGEPLTTLTGEELELAADDLVIATPQEGSSRAIGLAGVIGGKDDSVEADTATVALEVAHFDPVTVRRTAKRHSLSTDAHYRFERGVDPGLPPRASSRTAQLIVQVAGGTVHRGVSVVGSVPTPEAIAFRPSRVQFLVDFEVAAADQRRYLEALGCTVEEQGANGKGEETWRVTPPSWRFDMGIEEDLVEEVARLHGYEHIGETVPSMYFVPPLGDPTHRALRQELVGLGFQETIGYIFTSEAELARAAAPEPEVWLENPQGIERSVLRTALYPGLLAAAANNRQAASLAIFEVGRTFGEEERERVALVATGPWIEPGWQQGRPLDFFLFKGLLERLARQRNSELEMRPMKFEHLHPGISAQVLWNGEAIGSAGRLHPRLAASYELGDVMVAELELPLQAGKLHYREVPRQQHSQQDIAVVAPTDVDYARLHRIVFEAAGENLESVEPFDVYEGEQVPEGKRSVALHLFFRHPERALRDEEVDRHMQNVIGSLREHGYDVRDR